MVMPILIGLLAAGPADPPASGLAVHVRAASAEMRMLIADAAAQSPTLRDLIARLGCTDTIVYVEMTGSPQVRTARTKLVASVDGARFLRIGINTAVADADRAPLLAHELQHAVEIAEHGEVRDDRALRDLYRRIGHPSGADAFETDAAKGVEWTVRGEMRIKIGG